MSVTQSGRVWLKTLYIALALSLCAATAALSLAAAGGNILPGDVGLTRAVQDVEFKGIDRLERLGYFLGSTTGISVVSAAVITLLAVSRNLIEIVFVVAALALRTANPYIKELIASPRPSSDLVRVEENATGDPGSYGFPSGHVMGAVLIYGCLVYLTRTLIESPPLRIAVQTLASLAIVVTAFSRVYSGAHWPSDVLGSLLWGGAFLLLVYRLRSRWISLAT